MIFIDGLVPIAPINLRKRLTGIECLRENGRLRELVNNLSWQNVVDPFKWPLQGPSENQLSFCRHWATMI
jgi:hypothetical protein